MVGALPQRPEGPGRRDDGIVVDAVAGAGQVDADAARLVRSEPAWELPRIEGPTLWRAPEGLFLFYSAGDWETSGYVVGVARCSAPTGPCTRVYSTPVLASTDRSVAGRLAASLRAGMSTLTRSG